MTAAGGQRPGSGRPPGPKTNQRDRVVVAIGGELARKINDARRDLRLATNAETVRAILLRALK